MERQLQSQVRGDRAPESRFVVTVNEFFADKIARIQVIKKRQPVYLPGDPADYVYLLKTGRVKVSSFAQSGKEITLAILRPGDLFGIVEAFDGTPREAHAEALEDVVVGAIPREDFVRRIKEQPDLAMEFTRLLVFQLRKLQTRVQDLVFRGATGRLAHLLLDLSGATGSGGRSVLRIDARLTHQEMANVVGCARETVSTIMGQFREQGLIRINGQSITILNVDAVSRMVA